MIYTFDWKDVIHGKIEIEAQNGHEAEKIFNNMGLIERLSASEVGCDNNTLVIKFVDAGIGDLHTKEEWEEEVRNYT